jgi:CRISPR/Cas system-associated exonuclease Cas4 (RecB family)
MLSVVERRAIGEAAPRAGVDVAVAATIENPVDIGTCVHVVPSVER